MNRLLCLAVLAVACAKQPDRAPTADTVVAPTASVVTPDTATPAKKVDSVPAAVVAPTGLAGSKWKLVKFTGGNDSTIVPTDIAKYNVAFGADGKVNVQADCNRGSGTWSSPEPSTLKFSELATTMAACPPGSMSARFLRDFQYMRTWMQRNGHLYISLMADAGIYEFEPAS